VIFAKLNDFGCFVERHFAHRSAALAPTQRNGETFAIRLVRTAPAKMRPTLQQRSKLPRTPDIKLLEDRSRKPKHFEVLGKKGRRV
jgi:hypothetical protein